MIFSVSLTGAFFFKKKNLIISYSPSLTTLKMTISPEPLSPGVRYRGGGLGWPFVAVMITPEMGSCGPQQGKQWCFL